jgi:hypothetical protein
MVGQKALVHGSFEFTRAHPPEYQPPEQTAIACPDTHEPHQASDKLNISQGA